MSKREKLYKLVAKYKKKLKLTDIAINIVIAEDKVQQFRKRGRKRKAVSDCYAEVIEESIDGKEFTIFIFKSAFEEDLEDTVIHELSHILLHPMRNAAENLITNMDISDKKKKKLFDKFDDQEHKVVNNIIKMVRK